MGRAFENYVLVCFGLEGTDVGVGSKGHGFVARLAVAGGRLSVRIEVLSFAWNGAAVKEVRVADQYFFAGDNGAKWRGGRRALEIVAHVFFLGWEGCEKAWHGGHASFRFW